MEFNNAVRNVRNQQASLKAVPESYKKIYDLFLFCADGIENRSAKGFSKNLKPKIGPWQGNHQFRWTRLFL
jgi:hypothetical protein